MTKDLFEKFKQDEKTVDFARALQNEVSDYQEINPSPENSFYLLYNYLIVNYIMKTEESIKWRNLCFKEQKNKDEVQRKEINLLYSLLRKAGFFELSKA